MPEIIRQPVRFDCAGIDLVHPIDRMPPGAFPYLFNVRVLEEGRLESRPGYSPFISLSPGDTPNSIRRLNDPDRSLAPAGYVYVGGGGTKLYAGTESTYTLIDSGYSGNPLSLLTFRPEQSPESWMYVYDQAKQVKVRADGTTIRPIGVAPPTQDPVIDYGPPASVEISDGQSLTGWTEGGSAAAPTLASRFAPDATILTILYNSGSSGWACLLPSSTVAGTFDSIGERAQVLVNPAGGTQELASIREIHAAVTPSTIQGIDYDSGSTGLCTVVLTGSPVGLSRNSVLTLDAGGPNQEAIRVLSVTPTPDGGGYSFRCSTSVTHFAGEATHGFYVWYVYLANNHVPGEPLAISYVLSGNSTSGVSTASLSLLTSVDASRATITGTSETRPISLSDDWMHLSVFFSDVTKVTSFKIQIDIDPKTTGLGNAFTGNYFTWTIPITSLNNQWTEITVLLSSATRHGGDFTLNFSTIQAIQISAELSDPTDLGIDDWYTFGTYGPEIQPNSPVGYEFSSRFRDSSTGAASVPGPQSRYQLFPLREQMRITPQATNVPGVDSIDIYAFGGTLSQFLYVGTVGNNFASPGTFADNLPDSAILALGQVADLTKIQPWPVLTLPISGTVSVVGTTARITSGGPFPPTLLSGTVILINGTAYQTFGQPRSATVIELFSSAGVQSAAFQIASPTIAAQPLPFAFGPLEGPFSPVGFALGDLFNGGTLYFSNSADLDSASDQNTLELTGPSEPLVSGATWNGLVFTGSRDNLFLVRYSFLSASPFQWQKIPSPSGIWSRWACCSTPYGVAFLGRDGIYLATEQGAVSITDGALYPLFPHDGQDASPSDSGSNIILPVDMTELSSLRLAYCDNDLYFTYNDTGANNVVLRFEFSKKRWFLHTYADHLATFYLVEAEVDLPQKPQILLLSAATSNIYLSGGNSDSGSAINCIVLTPSFDGGDERAQKLFVDGMIQSDGTGPFTAAAAYDNAQSFSAVASLAATGSIQQVLMNLSSLSGVPGLALHRNIGLKLAWSGGPAGPRFYAWEPSGYVQPYLSTSLLTQFINLSISGWKHHRRLYAALISTAPVSFTIETVDNRTFTQSIPSTGGQFRIVPLMLPQAIKDLAFAYSLSASTPFAAFLDEFVIETKLWTEASYISLAVFKT